MHEYIEVPEYPFIVAAHDDWVVLYKPRGMHSSVHGNSKEHVLMTWAVSMMPELQHVTGYWDYDYGLVHRLDKETAGLLLIAKTQNFFDYITSSKTTMLKKLYALYAEINPDGLKGSLPLLYVPHGLSAGEWFEKLNSKDMPSIVQYIPHAISSMFRGYGKGKSSVSCRDHHIPDTYKHKWGNTIYTTHIISTEIREQYVLMNVMLERGFRHQIRAHCAWMGLPLIGDELYNTKAKSGEKLSLVACGLEFYDIKGKLNRIIL